MSDYRPQLSAGIVAKLFRIMLTIRRFEERVLEQALAGNIYGVVHSYIGQEAVAAGVCAHLGPTDWITSTHRSHGHAIAKGVDVRYIMAELFGRVDGTGSGKAGSMHLIDLSGGMLGANGIVGAGVPCAVGAALSAKLDKTNGVSVVFFGDGAFNQGVVHESMNLASIWRLPVIFVCENNHYADTTPVEYSTAVPRLADHAAGYSMPGLHVDGMDAFAVYEAAGSAISRARSEGGPSLLECDTYLFHGSYYGDDFRRYRLAEQEERYRARDPLELFLKAPTTRALLSEATVVQVQNEIEDVVQEAIGFAKASPYPSATALKTDVYA